MSSRRYRTSQYWATFVLFILLALGVNQSQGGFIPTIGDVVAPRPGACSSVVVSPDGTLLVTANPDSNSITIIDTQSQLALEELPVGLDPRCAAFTPDGASVWIANQGSDELTIVRFIGLTKEIEFLPVGDRPVGVAISPDGRFAAVAELGEDQIRLVEVASLKSMRLIQVENRPHGLSFTPDGSYILVTHLYSGRISVISFQPFSVYLPQIASGNPLVSVNLIANEANDFSQSTRQIPTWPQVAPAPSILVSPDGKRAYLPQTMANGLGLNTGFDTSVFPKVSVLNLETFSHQTSEHISLPETDRPVGLPWAAALTKQGQELWVVNSGSNDLSVINLSAPTRPKRTAHLKVGDHPTGIALDPTGSTAYVYNALAGTVSVIDTQAYTITQVITATTIPLPPALLHGKRLYFSSAEPELAQAAWISCATCHIEGEHDGRTWQLQYLGSVPPGSQPLVTRNTTSLLGMIETYPLRWSGEWDESADSEFSIRFEQFGSGLIPGEMHPTLGTPNQGRSYDLDCLAAFIDSLEVPARQHTPSEAELNGQKVFIDPQTACLDCHPPPLYTDLKAHDVGTADGANEWFGPEIDTPTLRFLYDSAPYLHDGSAATLEEILTVKNLNDEHGTTSHLSQAEIEDLVAFLLALPYQTP